MSDEVISAGSVSAETVTAPAPESAPASASETPQSAGTSGNSRNLDAKADYLSRIQQAAQNYPESDPAEAAVAAAEAAASTDPATDAPVSGESDQPVVEAQQAQAEEPAKAPVIPYDQLPENMRGALSKANLDRNVKEALAQAWYERKAFHDTGFTVDHARQLKTFGFTPEAAVDRIKLHPTVQDAQTDAQLADIARGLINDYATNPQAMIEGLRQHVPQGFTGFAQTFAKQLRQTAPEVFSDVASDVMWTAMSIMERELPEDALDEREHVAYVKAKLFPQQQGQSGGQASPFNPNDPIHRKYQEIVQSQQQQRAYMTQQFESALVQYGEEQVRTEVAERFRAAAPAGLPEEYVARAVEDIVSAVRNDVVNNRNVRDQIGRYFNGGLSQEELNAAVGFIADRARPLIAIHLKPQVDFWSKAARPATASTNPAVAPKPAVKPSAASPAASAQAVPGRAPAPTSPTTPPNDFIRAARAKGWDEFRILNEWSSGRR